LPNLGTIKSQPCRRDKQRILRSLPWCCNVYGFLKMRVPRQVFFGKSLASLKTAPWSFRRDPQPQSIGDNRHRTDAAEPQDGEPQETLRQRARVLPGLRQW
jgi:hypothetical protein